MERPRTARGQRGDRVSSSLDQSYDTGIANYETQRFDPEQLTDRPRTARGRRADNYGGGDYGTLSFDPRTFSQTSVERPRTARGSRGIDESGEGGSSVRSKNSESDDHFELNGTFQGNGDDTWGYSGSQQGNALSSNIDILKLDSDGEEEAYSSAERHMETNVSSSYTDHYSSDAYRQGNRDNFREKLKRSRKSMPAETTGLPQFYPSPPTTSSSNSYRRLHATTRASGIEKPDSLPPVPRRPGSSKFKVLPAIGSPEHQRVHRDVTNQFSDDVINKSHNRAMLVESVSDRLQPDGSEYSTSSAQRDVTRGEIMGTQRTSDVNLDRSLEGKNLARQQTLAKNVNNARTVSSTSSLQDENETAMSMSVSTSEDHNHRQNSRQLDAHIGQHARDKRQSPRDLLRPTVRGRSRSHSRSPQTRYKPLVEPRRLPREPGLEDERIALAIKLPTGQRVQRWFRPTDSLESALKFAENSARLDFTGCQLVRNDPKLKTFVDLTQTIRASKLPNKTLLHVQYPDDD